MTQNSFLRNYRCHTNSDKSGENNFSLTVKNMKDMKTYIIRAKLQNNKRIYRDIEVPENTTLYYLAKAILDSFNFDFDHLFGFGNKPGFYNSDIQYELITEDDEDSIFGKNIGNDVKKNKYI